MANRKTSIRKSGRVFVYTEMRLTSERSSTMSNTLICYGIFRCILDSSNVNFEKIVFFRIALLLSEKLNDRSDP